ncbi:unnamed protein product [Acanthoscelides obtectus]|uniref:Uncharacterized protein n=1 Tax=Acanthoscelides obtectus TaxID=200917 RepID=A0A9P0KQE5_ACAOB|nr:unnamed protein product [Acanthoscelides obtectus]CAK1655178.1 hypothetical protein AOBTE_LOCUS19064 [Acanthoscelides obtectus]
MIKRTIFYLLVVNYLLFAQEPPPNGTYNVPSNCKFPFGYEQQINVNDLDNHTNKVHCVEGKDLNALEGKCPLDPTNGSLMKYNVTYQMFLEMLKYCTVCVARLFYISHKILVQKRGKIDKT